MRLDFCIPEDELKSLQRATREVELGQADSPLRGKIVDLWFEHIDLFRRCHAEKCVGGEKWDRRA